jgi:hypothetical protein
MSNAPMNANMGHTGVPTSQPRHGSGVSIKRRLESFATSGVTVRSQGHEQRSDLVWSRSVEAAIQPVRTLGPAQVPLDGKNLVGDRAWVFGIAEEAVAVLQFPQPTLQPRQVLGSRCDQLNPDLVVGSYGRV